CRRAVARGEGGFEAGVQALDQIASDGVWIDALAERRVDGDGEAGQRCRHLERIAMQVDDARVGIGCEDVLDPENVRRRLEDPPFSAMSPLQMLEDAAVVRVGRPEI